METEAIKEADTFSCTVNMFRAVETSDNTYLSNYLKVKAIFIFSTSNATNIFKERHNNYNFFHVILALKKYTVELTDMAR